MRVGYCQACGEMLTGFLQNCVMAIHMVHLRLMNTTSYLDPIADFVTPERNWWDDKYESRLGNRYSTFRAAFIELFKRSGPERSCVETGCVREKDDYSAGYSTVLIGELLAWYGGHLDTVDLSGRRMKLCKKVTSEYAGSIRYHVSDSVKFLKSWNKPIDFLYLDSYDYPSSPRDGSIEPPQQHCLAELEAALPNLHSGSIILIDDGRLPGGGKPGLANKRLAELGWECVLNDYQILWRKL